MNDTVAEAQRGFERVGQTTTGIRADDQTIDDNLNSTVGAYSRFVD